MKVTGKELLGFSSVPLYPHNPLGRTPCHDGRRIMTDKQREIAETVFERSVRREAEINDALKQ